MLERRQETKIVKAALEKAGHTCQVRHGKGTAWGWLSVHAEMNHHPECYCTKHSYGVQETCHKCSEHLRAKHNAILDTTMAVTGRTGEYHGRINVHLGFKPEEYESLPVID